MALLLLLSSISQVNAQIRPSGDCPDITLMLFGASSNECEINVLVKDIQGSTNIDYVWTIDGVGVLGQTTNNLITTVPENGTYTVCWTGTVPGSSPPCSDSGCTTVVVNDCDEPDPDPDPDPVCPPNQIVINNAECTSTGGGDASASWNVNANDVDYITWRYSIGPHSNVPLPTTSGNSWGLHQVNWNLPQAGQPIPGTWDNYVLVVKARAYLVDGTVCAEYIKTLTLVCPGGGGGTGGNKVVLSPNPTQDAFQILNDGKAAITEVQVTDTGGNVVKVMTNNFASEIRLDDQRAGVYFVAIKFDDGSSIVKKLIRK